MDIEERKEILESLLLQSKAIKTLDKLVALLHEKLEINSRSIDGLFKILKKGGN